MSSKKGLNKKDRIAYNQARTKQIDTSIFARFTITAEDLSKTSDSHLIALLSYLSLNLDLIIEEVCKRHAAEVGTPAMPVGGS